MNASGLTRFARRHNIWPAVFIALVLLVVSFNWNWLRHPLDRYISKKTERTFTISDLQLRLGRTPTMRMRDLVFANAK
ncbi:MAG: AsmA family protein [Rhodoferax sp.]|nr:AsmA family protein [Rhodoferax sp.]